MSFKMQIDRKVNRHIVDTDRCVENIGNRFNLVLVASQRARELENGHRKLTTGSDGNIITALKEIEEGLVGKDFLRKIR
jgi:DNA-directed RNA polymerase subunit omega